MRADHFAFQVSDLDEALAFYTEKLGLELMFREQDDQHHEAFAFLALEGGNLELLQILDEHNAPIAARRGELAPPYCPHLALATDDLGELAGMLHRRNVPIVEGPMEIPGKVRWLYIADPDNNVVEFVQWL